MTIFADRARCLAAESAFQMLPLIQAMEKKGHKVIRLHLGEPDFNLPNCIKTAIKKEVDNNNTRYCDPQGLLALREAIAEKLYKTRTLEVSADRIVITPGSKPSIAFSQQIYCNPGEEILYPSPCFAPYESLIPLTGALPKPLTLEPQDHFILSPKRLSENLSLNSKLLFLNYPSNPTGAVLNNQAIADLGAVILQQAPEQFRIFSDEIYEDIRFENHPVASFTSHPELSKKTILCSGFSKSHAWTGGRIGYVVLPTPEEAQYFRIWNTHYFSCVSPYQQAAAVVALTDPEAQQALESMRAAFEKRRDSGHAALLKIPGITCTKPLGAFYLFPNIEAICQRLGILEAHQQLPPSLQSEHPPSRLFKHFLLETQGVTVMDRLAFAKAGAQGQHFIRISIAAPEADLLEGIERIKQASQDKNGFQAFLQKYLKTLALQ